MEELNMETAKVLKNNIVTIPKSVREKLGLKVGDKVVFTEVENSYVFRKLDEQKMNQFLLIDTKASYGSEKD